MSQLVLSLFPGGGFLDRAFEAEGFTVVRGPDVLWGGDIRTFHPPPGRFDGIIGGDPCQSHSALANLVRAKGLEPSFPDMTPEYERVVNEARPAWFLRENVPQAPDIKPAGYSVRSFLLDLSTLDDGTGWGHEQMRKRRWWFGVRDAECPELRRWIDFALFELPDYEKQKPCVAGHDHAPGTRDRYRTQAVAADQRDGHVALGGPGKRKVTAVGGHDGTADALGDKAYREARSNGDDYAPPKRDLAEMLRLQGFPADYFGEHTPFTMQARRKMVGNAVALPMGRALAKAVRTATETRP